MNSFDAVRDLIQDPAFAAIRKKFEEQPLTWAEFTAMKMPSGLDYEQTWEIITELRRQTGVNIPNYLVDAEGNYGWYTFTKSMYADLRRIDERCCRDSQLDVLTRERHFGNVFSDTFVMEVLDVAFEDGVMLDRAAARAILYGRRAPQSPEEQVVFNIGAVIGELEAFSMARLTPKAIRDIHALIRDKAPQRTRPPEPIGVGHDWVKGETDSDSLLFQICCSVNQEGVTDIHHPILSAMIPSYLFPHARPLPSWNGVMGALVSKILFHRAGLPALALVSPLKLQRRWRRAQVVPPMVQVPHEESLVLFHGSIDFTLFNAVLVRLVSYELTELEATIHEVEMLGKRLVGGIRANPKLNHRQKDLLVRVINDPSLTFEIKTHQQSCRVAYATARADLFGLVDAGYFDRIQQGREYFFAPSLPFVDRLFDLSDKWAGGNVWP